MSPLSSFRDSLDTFIQEKHFDSPYASFALPFTDEFIRSSNALASELADYKHMALIGIGGSNLGTVAVQSALKDILSSGKDITYFDTTDGDDMQDSLDILWGKLEQGEKVVLTVVSKSGGTTETIALASTVYDFLRQYFPDQFTVVTISDSGSKLDQLAQEQNWKRLSIPKQVGGRYSVLSNVGLFPLAFLGVRIEELVAGARRSIDEILTHPEGHPATEMATGLFEQYPDRNIIEHWFFAKKFENLGKWYRQLLAESIGKIQENGTSVGITPVTAVGTIDLHSSAQEVLAHGEDRSVMLVRETENETVAITESPFLTLLPHLRGKSLVDVMDAASLGFEEALRSKNIPTYTAEISSKSAQSVGYWLETKMLEVALLAHLLGVNAFDQPNVEDYKRHMEPRLKD